MDIYIFTVSMKNQANAVLAHPNGTHKRKEVTTEEEEENDEGGGGLKKWTRSV